MIFSRATLNNCAAATGTVVVIDVLRAFSTAAFAFAAGVSDILLVREVEEAEALRLQFPEARITGEVGGRHVPGFDFGNSPSELMGVDLAGRRLIQRTSGRLHPPPGAGAGHFCDYWPARRKRLGCR